jgi:flagellar biogenesis protein FliO
VSIEDDDDLHELARVMFVVIGLIVFVAWAVYDGVGSFLDL